jgi:glycosyltransferase involved in cell wall biosynthesis
MIIKIAIDVRHLSEPITGIGRYLYEILNILVLDKNIEWHLYSHRKIIIGQWSGNNIKIHECKITNRFMRMLWAQIYLPFSLKKNNIDIFWSPAHRIPLLISKDIRSVVTIHDLVWKFHPKTMRFFSQLLDMVLMPISMKIADKIICVSNSTEQDIAAYFPKLSKKLVTIYEAPTTFNYRNSSLLIAYPFILFVGTLEPRKNLRKLLQALKVYISNKKNKVKLLIVGGSGWGNVNLENLILELDLSEHVILMGYVSDCDLAYLYKNAIFTVMPSLYEGFGLPILESFAYGTPVITSNNSSMMEIGGKAAHFIDPNSVTSIKDGLDKLLSDNDYLNRLRGNTKIEAEKYSWENASIVTLECLLSTQIGTKLE